MSAAGENWTTADDDAAIESALLQQVIALHPTQVTVEELVRELAGETSGFTERDAIERAVRDLSATGLLHHREGFVVPTRAALRFSELLDR
ncbi:MAG: hypothetical protein ABW065_03865 [Solirubrobacterales bacterium]